MTKSPAKLYTLDRDAGDFYRSLLVTFHCPAAL